MRSDNAKILPWETNYCAPSNGYNYNDHHMPLQLYTNSLLHIYNNIWVPFLNKPSMVVIVVPAQLDLCLDWNVETRKEQYIYFTYYILLILHISMKLSSWAITSKTSITQQCALASSYIYAMFVSTSIYYFLWPDLRFPAIRSIIVVAKRWR